MKTKIVAAFAALMFTTVTTAHAQTGDSYFGINLMNVSAETSTNLEYSHPVLVLRGGYQATPYVALEGRLGIGVGDDSLGTFTQDGFTFDVSVKVERLLGAYVRISPSVTETQPYLLLGITDVTVEATASDNVDAVSVDDSDNSFGWAIGLDHKFDRNRAIGGEYWSYYGKNGISHTAFGVKFTFYQ